MNMEETNCPGEGITHLKILAAEGKDAKFFFEQACRAYSLTDYQCLIYGGVDQLETWMKSVRLIKGFEKVKVIVILRDAETSASRACQAIQDALRRAGFAVPKEPFVPVTDPRPGEPKTAFAIIPGFEDDGRLTEVGTLEDLCLAIAADKGIIDCAESFLSCCETKGAKIKRRHKMKLHAYLAGHHEFAGLKLGEAARANAWNWGHPKMKPFKDMLSGLL